MIRYLLDTNVVSEPSRAKPSDHVLHRMKFHTGQMAICAISLHEMIRGIELMAGGRRKESIEAYVDSVRRTLPVVFYDTRAAEWHALERTRLERSGRTPQLLDSQIAAIAYVNDLTLVTANVKDFEVFDGIEIENWFEAKKKAR